MCAAVQSVCDQTVAAKEVVLVVDHHDALLAKARAALPEIVVIPNEERAGLSGARNSGARATTAAVIAYLDDDAVAAPDWIEQLLHAYTRPALLGVGGHISPRWATRRPAWFPAEFDWVVGSTYRGVPREPARIRNPIGANMSMLREVFDAVGGFRPELGRLRHSTENGLEETDFCIRAEERFPARMWLHWPAARVVHVVSPERETWRFFLERCHNEGLAKAAMVSARGRRAGLASERRYVRATLPAGVARELSRALRGRPSGLLRAGAIIIGLAATIFGYLRGIARRRESRAAARSLTHHP